MDDPFLSPRRGGGDTSSSSVPLDLDAPPILTRATTSPAQLKRTLQAHLAETRKRLEGAGQLGKKLVQQEEDIESRLRELEESGGKIDSGLKDKLAALEKDYNDVGRETTRAMLTNRVVAGQENGNVSVF